jgi:hypothetical protein
MRRLIGGEAVAETEQHGAQGLVASLPVRPDLLADFLEPRVGRLQGLVEDF